MTRHRPASALQRPRPPGKAVWVAARMVLLMLIGSVAWARLLAPGKTRNALLRFTAARTGWLEHVFRCLLIVLRARPAAPKPAPFIAARAACPAGDAPRRQRKYAQLSLSLQSLARGFEQAGKAHPLLEDWKARQARPLPPPRPATPRAPLIPRCPADPAALLEARLAALKAVLADPYPHAARMAAILKAAGFCLRRLASVIPNGEIWAILHQAAPGAPPALCSGPRADTS